MSPKVDAFVDRHGWQIVGGIIAAVIAWQALAAQVRSLDVQKADKSEVQAVSGKLDGVVRRQDAILRMLCRDPRNRSDTACP